ncbi:MAG TPA: MlaD family protein [Longimicrobiales bacterium]|nr:MlaD family protein [Longimicrobiales bacterium]
MRRRAIRNGQAGWRFARVGVVILAGLALLAYLTYEIGDIFDVWTRRYELVAYFPNVTGVSKDAPVSLAGYRVGQVASIEFVPPQDRIGDGNVRVRFWIAHDVHEQVRSDSRVRLRLQGLMGDRYLDIEPGSPEAPILEPGAAVRTVPPVDIEQDILEPLAQTLLDAGDLVLGLRSVVSGLIAGRGALGRLLTDDSLYVHADAAARELAQALAQVNRADGTLHRLLHDPAVYMLLESTLHELETFSRSLNEGQGTLGLLLTDDELYRRAVALTADADSLLARLSGVTELLTSGGGTVQQLLEDPAMYDMVLKAIVDVQNLIADIRANPERFRPGIDIDLFP